MDRREQAQAAATRYRATKGVREEIRRRQAEEGVRVVDTTEQIAARAGRLVETGQVPASALLAAVREPATPTVVLERIIAEHNDLQPVTFLVRGAEVAGTVGRIGLDRDGRVVPFGTGFLVAPRLLLTNNHVLPDPGRATASVVEFGCDPGRPPSDVVTVRFDPDRLFLTDEHLDYTLAVLADLPDGRPPGEVFGWNPLISQQGKIVTGEPVNIIGHPMGRTKEIAVRNNELTNQLDDFLHYATDTEPGNSGSPVFNDTWEVVALHHAGVPDTDEDGHWRKQDGSRWQPGDGDEAVHWIANEGARVSVLLRHLASLELAPTQQALLDELSAPAPSAVPAPRDAVGPATSPVAPTAVGAVAPSEGARGAPPTPAELKTGVPARGHPYDGDVQLVFLHGRSQQGRDPVKLRRSWAAGLAKGLARAGLPAVDPDHVWFPFYGDAFAAALSARESMVVVDPDAVPAEALAPADPTARSLYESLIEEAATAAGMPASAGAEGRGGDAAETDVAESRLLGGAVSRVQRQLTWLANRSGLDDLVIARAFRDVAAYLDRPEMRDLVLDKVLATLPSDGPVVLICHSLGTVVGLDLLTRLRTDVEVVQLVTAGSPLGMDAVYKRLLVGGPNVPDRVDGWLNAWCAADAVAIGCPLAPRWGRRVIDVATDNPKDRAHDIEEYLADEQVARAVGDRLRHA